MRRLLGVILLVICPLIVWADGSMWWNTDYNTTEGTEFYVTFMVNVGKQVQDEDLALYLFATARQKTDIRIQGTWTDPISKNQKTYDQTFTVSAGGVDSIKIPNEVAYLQNSNQTNDAEWLNKGIHVTSNKPISLYSLNSNNDSYDVSLIVPVNGLNKEYIIQTLSKDKQGTEFAIVSAANRNDVTIHLLETSTDGDGNVVVTPSEIQIYLNKGQTYCYRPKDAAISLTGTTICATKPISVLQGGQYANPPSNTSTASHIYEQVFSTDYWGKTFCVTRTHIQDNDLIRITAAEDNTKIYEDGIIVKTINSLETYEKQIKWSEGQQAIIYTTSKAVQCNLYATNAKANKNTGFGSPAMTTITPQEQGIRSIILAPFNETRTKELDLDAQGKKYLEKNYLHFVNVVTKTTDVKSMRLDGTNISSQFSPIGTSEYSSACIQISIGSHILENTSSSASFTVRSYGLYFEDTEDPAMELELGYACSGGSNTHHNAYFLIDGQRIKDKTICINHPPLTFTSVISYDYDSVYWLFDNIGTTAPKVQTKHGDSVVVRSYSSTGTDNVRMVVERKTPLCQNTIRDTIRATIHVKDTYSGNFTARACKGETVSVKGRDINGNVFTIPYTTDVNADSLFYTVDGCDSIVHIDIKFGEPKTTDISATACDQYSWKGKTYKESGIYQWIGETTYGCDSTVNLNLTINHSVSGPIEQRTICEKSSLSWNGLTITKAGTYHATLQAQNGCDSLCTIEVTIEKLVTETTQTTICNEDSFVWRGKAYYQSDTITEISPSPCGCDSTLILQLVVLPKNDDTIPAWICEEDSIFFIDTYYRHEGTYTHHLKSAIYGCDSMVTLDLHLYSNENSVIYDTTCSNHPYPFDGKELTQSGTYIMEQNTAQGCKQLTTLHLEVLQVYDSLLRDTICVGDTYYWEGNTYTKSGLYQKDFKTIHGCDSIMRLELTVNDTFNIPLRIKRCSKEGPYNHPDTRAEKLQNLSQSGIYRDTLQSVYGCDSILVLDLSIYPNEDSVRYDTTCSNHPYLFNNEEKTQSGIYTMTRNTEQGCEQLITLHLVVYQAYDSLLRDTICEGETYTWEDSTYTKAGFYHKDYKTIHGCDSIMRLELVVNDTFRTYIDTTWCSDNDIYNHPDGRATKLQGLKQSGTYIDTIPTIHGCDSILTLNLNVIAVVDTTIYDTICANETCLFDGKPLNQTGTYYKEEAVGAVCSRTVTLQLVVHPIYDFTLRDTICAGETYTWEDSTYTKAGFYHKDYKTIHGCDSVRRLELVVMPTYNNPVVSDQWCAEDGPYYYFDKRANNFQGLTQTGEYKDTLKSIYGCDSIITLDLKVWPFYDLTDTTRVSICDNEPYPFQGTIYNQHGEWKTADHSVRHDTLIGDGKSIHGCDSSFVHIVTTYPTYDSLLRDTICKGETYYWEGENYTKAGLYQKDFKTIHGCDSIMRLELTVNDTFNIPLRIKRCSKEGPYNHPDTRAEKLQNLSQSGIYRDTLQSVYGCDSILVLDLSIYPNEDSVRYDTTCSNHPYLFNNEEKTQSGIYTMTRNTEQGCEQLITLHLVVYQAYDSLLRDTICEGETYYWEGENYTQAGSYHKDYHTIHGCDSIMRLELTVNDTFNIPLRVERCSKEGPYNHPDSRAKKLQNLSQSDIYRDTLKSIYGCDSILVLDLSIYPNEDSVRYDTTCSNHPYLFNNEEKTQSGIYTMTRNTEQGCEQLITLHLVVYQAYDSLLRDTICAGDTCYWEGRKLTESGSYDTTYQTIHGCDSIRRLELVVMPTYNNPVVSDEWCAEDGPYYYFDKRANNFQGLTQTGEYKDTLKSIYGCDSIITLDLKVWPFYDLTDTTRVSICDNEPYPFQGTIYNQHGEWKTADHSVRHDTLIGDGKSIHGCDSSFVHIVTTYPTYEFVTTQRVCFGDTVYWEGRKLTQTGIYEELKHTIHGCDSLLVLNLYVKPVIRKKRYLSGCEDEVFMHNDTIRSGSREVIISTSLWDPYSNLQDAIVHKEHTELVDVTFPSKDGACDSIVYEYHIHLFPMYINEKEATFCSNEMYPINSVHKVGIDTLFDYREDVAPFDTIYRDTLPTVAGCDSIFILNAHILPASIHRQQDTICFGDELSWCEQTIRQGSEDYHYSTSGEYTFRYTYEKQNGCDSVIELRLVVMPTFTDSIHQEWCSKDGVYNYPDTRASLLQNLAETGVYRDTLTTLHGCDSIIIIDLLIHPNEDIDIYDTICSNEAYEFNNKLISQTGVYQKIEQLPNGCPQTTILHLTVYPAYEDTTKVTICYGDTCYWEDSIFTIEGEYIEHKYTIHDCDSILHLLLSVEPDYNTYTTDSICQGEQYFFEDEWLTEPGDYIHAHSSVLGCDSSHYLTLLRFDTTAIFDTTTICENEYYDFHGQIITEAGIYVDSALNEHGCLIHTYLTVHSIPPTIAHVSVDPLCADQEAFEVDFTYEGTEPIAFSLLYDSFGHSQGFVDIRHQMLENDSVIVVATPFRDGDITKYPRPDHYPITLILHNGICQNDSLYPSQTDIIMNYPSWVTEQRFGDLIGILNEKYNGGYTFDKFQWYENGKKLIGETRPYLYLPHKLELTEYYVELTRTGETEAFQTCPMLVVPDALDTIAPRLPYISLTPTYICSENPKANILSLTSGIYHILNSSGIPFSFGKYDGSYTPDIHKAYEIDVPSTPGIYIITMQETDPGIFRDIPHETTRSQVFIVY
ncbi:MAG: IgGFc-binding protein [Paludibacteraceae bacterium]|nr:IgGFc-binding protein [Paludibacteraceae bacterium]